MFRGFENAINLLISQIVWLAGAPRRKKEALAVKEQEDILKRRQEAKDTEEQEQERRRKLIAKGINPDRELKNVTSGTAFVSSGHTIYGLSSSGHIQEFGPEVEEDNVNQFDRLI